MTIVSDPPGALCYVDNYEIGTTPVSTDFLYYGVREIRLVKDGYETLTVKQPMRAPWYQWFPLDFVSENIVPWEIRDQRELRFAMQPQMVVLTQQLLSRAEGLRQSTQQQAAATAAATQPVVVEPTAPRQIAPLHTTVEPYAPAAPLPAPGNLPPPSSPYGGTAVPNFP